MYGLGTAVQCVVLFLLCGRTDGHARMIEPPMRSTMWRYGFKTPVNYNDNELFCGGLAKFAASGGKCGTCGDAHDIKQPPNEAGGKYATGTIARYYPAGVTHLPASVDVTAHHKGYFEFRICPHNNPDVRVTQDCLDENLLIIEEGFQHGTPNKFFPPGLGKWNVSVRIPTNITCTQCVFQLRYRTGNSWGRYTKDSEPCLGCGYQEEFRNCADISIGYPEPSTTTSLTTEVDAHANGKEEDGDDHSSSHGHHDHHHHDHNHDPHSPHTHVHVHVHEDHVELEKVDYHSHEAGHAHAHAHPSKPSALDTSQSILDDIGERLDKLESSLETEEKQRKKGDSSDFEFRAKLEVLKMKMKSFEKRILKLERKIEKMNERLTVLEPLVHIVGNNQKMIEKLMVKFSQRQSDDKPLRIESVSKELDKSTKQRTVPERGVTSKQDDRSNTEDSAEREDVKAKSEKVSFKSTKVPAKRGNHEKEDKERMKITPKIKVEKHINKAHNTDENIEDGRVVINKHKENANEKPHVHMHAPKREKSTENEDKKRKKSIPKMNTNINKAHNTDENIEDGRVVITKNTEKAHEKPHVHTHAPKREKSTENEDKKRKKSIPKMNTNINKAHNTDKNIEDGRFVISTRKEKAHEKSHVHSHAPKEDNNENEYKKRMNVMRKMKAKKHNNKAHHADEDSEDGRLVTRQHEDRKHEKAHVHSHAPKRGRQGRKRNILDLRKPRVILRNKLGKESEQEDKDTKPAVLKPRQRQVGGQKQPGNKQAKAKSRLNNQHPSSFKPPVAASFKEKPVSVQRAPKWNPLLGRRGWRNYLFNRYPATKRWLRPPSLTQSGTGPMVRGGNSIQHRGEPSNFRTSNTASRAGRRNSELLKGRTRFQGRRQWRPRTNVIGNK